MPQEKLTPSKLIVSAAIAAPLGGAIIGGTAGVLSRTAVSFFNPTLASAAGTFGTFATVSALSTPLSILPSLLLKNLRENSPFLSRHPALKEAMVEITDCLLTLGSIALAATMLGMPPFGATVIMLAVIPATFHALTAICNIFNTLTYAKDPLDFAFEQTFTH